MTNRRRVYEFLRFTSLNNKDSYHLKSDIECGMLNVVKHHGLALLLVLNSDFNSPRARWLFNVRLRCRFCICLSLIWK